MTYDLNYIYKEMVINNDNIYFKENVLQNQIYEKEYFDTIKITGDGNCLFRTVSYYLNKTENNYSKLRTMVYN